MFKRLAITAVFLCYVLQGADRFLGADEGLKFFTPTTAIPKSAHCEGNYIPIQATFVGGEIRSVSLWE